MICVALLCCVISCVRQHMWATLISCCSADCESLMLQMPDPDTQDVEAYMHLGFYNVAASANSGQFCCRANFQNQTITQLAAAGNCATLGTSWMNQLRLSQATTQARSNISVNFPAGFFAANGIQVPAPDGELARFQIIFSAFANDEVSQQDTIDVTCTGNVTFRPYGGSICNLNDQGQTYRIGIFGAQQVGPDTSQIYNLLVLEINILNDQGATVTALFPHLSWKTATGTDIQNTRTVSIVRVLVDYP